MNDNETTLKPTLGDHCRVYKMGQRERVVSDFALQQKEISSLISVRLVMSVDHSECTLPLTNDYYLIFTQNANFFYKTQCRLVLLHLFIQFLKSKLVKIHTK